MSPLPMLYGDRLVGKIDVIADREAGLFRIAAVDEDVWWSTAAAVAIAASVSSRPSARS